MKRNIQALECGGVGHGTGNTTIHNATKHRECYRNAGGCRTEDRQSKTQNRSTLPNTTITEGDGILALTSHMACEGENNFTQHITTQGRDGHTRTHTHAQSLLHARQNTTTHEGRESDGENITQQGNSALQTTAEVSGAQRHKRVKECTD